MTVTSLSKTNNRLNNATALQPQNDEGAHVAHAQQPLRFHRINHQILQEKLKLNYQCIDAGDAGTDPFAPDGRRTEHAQGRTEHTKEV